MGKNKVNWDDEIPDLWRKKHMFQITNGPFILGFTHIKMVVLPYITVYQRVSCVTPSNMRTMDPLIVDSTNSYMIVDLVDFWKWWIQNPNR